jgi:protein-S-isoprenylcysteine O-methyltransferase Ste14
MTNHGRPAWWKGERGEWLVAGQVVLMTLLFFGPRTLSRSDTSPVFQSGVRWYAGAVLALGGVSLLLAGIIRLGPALTPLPFPKDQAPLVQTGPFALVRHPMYSGGLAHAVGIALLTVGWLTWVYTAALFLLLDVKSRREERWLADRFSEYGSYQRRVRKLVPFVY